MIRRVNCLLLLLLATSLHAQTVAAPEKISHGNFRDVALYRPIGPLKQVVIVLSDQDGWDAQADGDARALARAGAFVAGIDTPQMRKQFAGDGKGCVFPDGDLENLSHYLQGYAQLPGYHAPLLVGQGSGAAVAYAMAAQGDRGVFAGALTVDFAPLLDLGRVPCEGKDNIFQATPATGARTALLPAPSLSVPWVALASPAAQARFDAKAFVGQVRGAALTSLPAAGNARQVRRAALVAAAQDLAKHQATAAVIPPPPQDLAGLPLTLVGGAGNLPSDTYAVLLSGDGGWAGLDQEVADAIAARGIPVVGFDSLRYFWKKRTPEGLASDLDRVLDYYRQHLGKSKVILIGYSQGADVLPFAVNRLSGESRAQLTQVVYLGLSGKAAFEFHLANWMSDDVPDGQPTMPEILKLDAAHNVCIYGQGDEDQICSQVPAGHLRVQALTGGHHFDGNYAELAQVILAAGMETAASP